MTARYAPIHAKLYSDTLQEVEVNENDSSKTKLNLKINYDLLIFSKKLNENIFVYFINSMRIYQRVASDFLVARQKAGNKQYILQVVT